MLENYKKTKRRIPVATIVCAALAVIVLGVSAILIMETEIRPAVIIYGALGIYLFSLLWIVVISIIRNRMTKGSLADIKSSVFGTISFSFVYTCSSCCWHGIALWRVEAG